MLITMYLLFYTHFHRLVFYGFEIYIENQNFVSATAGGGVRNMITIELIRRIKRAIRKKETFHVYLSCFIHLVYVSLTLKIYVMIPITPDGQITDQTARSLMHWNYQTICRGGTSILEQLRKDCPEVDPFDCIFSLVVEYTCF